MNYSEEKILALILAAGKGTRMKSSKPKVLHEIFGVPLIGWVIKALGNIKSIAVIGHGAELVQKYMKNYPDSLCVLQEQQLGTGHAVMCAKNALKDFNGSLLILCGDTPLITSSTIQKFINFHRENNSTITLMTALVDNPKGYGRIIRNEDGNLVGIVEEKDATPEQKLINEINTGVYLINWQEVLPAFSELSNNNNQGEYYLTDIISWAHKKSLSQKPFVIEDDTELYGINSRENLEEATRIMNQRHLKFLMEEGVTIVDKNCTYISPESTIEPDTTVFPSTYIEGKNQIGKNCKIGPMAHLRGNVVVGDNCKIGNFVELKNAKVGNNTNVAHLTYVGDATLGSNINIGAGTIFANYNSLTKEKNHTVLKDGVSIGSNCVLVAPVELGENAFIAAGSTITKNVEKNSLAIAREKQKEIKNWIKEQ